MADVSLDTPIAVTPAKPRAAFRTLLHNPAVLFGGAVIMIRLAVGAARALARHHRPRRD